jgi:hypothetical protein
MTKLLGLLKLKSNTELDALVTGLVKKAINFAEAWASKQAEKPAGEEKLQIAVGFILDQLNAYKVPAIATEKLIELIEGQLRRDKDVASDSGVPVKPTGEGNQ